MNACLMYPDRDFEVVHRFGPCIADVKNDLELDTLLRAMAGEDPLIYDVAQTALLDSFSMEVETVLYRQAALRDAIANPDVLRELYRLTGAAIEGKRHFHFGIFINFPSGILHSSLDLMKALVDILRQVRSLADGHGQQFSSPAFTELLAMFQREFSDAYFKEIEDHLSRLKLKGGVLESARLGPGNEGVDYVLRKPNETRIPWLDRLLRRHPPAYTFRLADRDEAGARELSELRDRGLNLVANALAQSTEHILSFFEMLRTELAFYVGCVNLSDKLTAMGSPSCFPVPSHAGMRAQRFEMLYDPSLALQMGHAVVGNTVDVGQRALVIITGANQGGKSSFLRSVGLAQLMMQGGMFVAAESFAGELCASLFTHYKREEDDTMTSGKFDEELRRMSDIADSLRPNALLLFNESFASTNEREGSEISRQIVHALLESGNMVYFVTHLYDFAHSIAERLGASAKFLRAERQADGTRTFKLIEALPLDTSYGEDLYREVFLTEHAESA